MEKESNIVLLISIAAVVFLICVGVLGWAFYHFILESAKVLNIKTQPVPTGVISGIVTIILVVFEIIIIVFITGS